MGEIGNAHGGQDRGREEAHKEERAGAHGNNIAASRPRAIPSSDEDVLAYHRVRLELIPLRQRDKVPADRRWQDRNYDHQQTIERVRREGLNLGVCLPADVVVVDVDPRNFAKGQNGLDELVAAFGLELATVPHVRTGNLDHPGHHYYFRKPKGVALLDTMKGFEGIEFKSLGRQVVAAGSIHPTGGRYQWANNSPSLSEMPELPQELLDAVRRPGRTKSSSAGEITPEQLAGSLSHLDACNFAEHEAWLKLMMACHHATDGEGRQEFIDWSTSDPNYADHEWLVGRRWDSLHSNRDDAVTIATLRKYLNEAGADIAPPAPEDDFEVWEDDAKTVRLQRRWNFLTIDELEALPPPKWLIPSILTEGSLAAIYGAPESGKSFLAVDMSMAIAGGMKWHGHAVEQGAVLYVAAEGAPGLGKRVRAWKLEHTAQEQAFEFCLMRDELNLAAEQDGVVRSFVKTVTDELGPLKLIVIDTLNQTAAGADENSAKDMGRYIASMKRLRDDTGATVMVVHHSGKDTTKGMRGSTALLGAFDTTIEVERDKDGRSIRVAVQKQKDAERAAPMRFNLEKVADSLVLRPTVVSDPACDFDGMAAPVVELVCQMAQKCDGKIELKEFVTVLMAQLRCSDATARRRISTAIPEGQANKVGLPNGLRVWREPVDSRNPKLGIVIRTEL